jgi:hypothetical protein
MSDDAGPASSSTAFAATAAAAAAMDMSCSTPQELADKLACRNRWIQSGLALQATTEAVAKYVESVFASAHLAVLDRTDEIPDPESLAKSGPTLYTYKQPDTRKPLADKFAALHRNRNPGGVTWPNADATKWGTPGCHIEIAKLYCSPLGDHTTAILKTNFKQLDGTAVFNMLDWCNSFDMSLQKLGVIARRARNKWCHEGAAQLSLDVCFIHPFTCLELIL